MLHLTCGPFLSFYGKFRRYMHAIEVASGALLIALGLFFSLDAARPLILVPFIATYLG